MREVRRRRWRREGGVGVELVCFSRFTIYAALFFFGPCVPTNQTNQACKSKRAWKGEGREARRGRASWTTHPRLLRRPPPLKASPSSSFTCSSSIPDLSVSYHLLSRSSLPQHLDSPSFCSDSSSTHSLSQPFVLLVPPLRPGFPRLSSSPPTIRI